MCPIPLLRVDAHSTLPHMDWWYLSMKVEVACGLHSWLQAILKDTAGTPERSTSQIRASQERQRQ